MVPKSQEGVCLPATAKGAFHGRPDIELVAQVRIGCGHRFRRARCRRGLHSHRAFGSLGLQLLDCRADPTLAKPSYRHSGNHHTRQHPVAIGTQTYQGCRHRQQKNGRRRGHDTRRAMLSRGQGGASDALVQ